MPLVEIIRLVNDIFDFAEQVTFFLIALPIHVVKNNKAGLSSKLTFGSRETCTASLENDGEQNVLSLLRIF